MLGTARQADRHVRGRRDQVARGRGTPPATAVHLRTDGGRQEVDLLLEYDGGSVFGVEIKASASPTVRDARHLAWLAEQLGDRFLGGAVFHTGPEIIQLDARIHALPICALWGTTP